MGSTLFFLDDEAGYLDWTKSHPDGFVVNTNRVPSPKFMVLHHANCTNITEYKDDTTSGAFTEREFGKACAEKLADLKAWARKRGRKDGSFTAIDCPVCQPWRSEEIDWEA